MENAHRVVPIEHAAVAGSCNVDVSPAPGGFTEESCLQGEGSTNLTE
jgi:hypothetical protein